MATKTMQDLFIHALSDVYSAEKQLTKALPKLARASTHVTPPRFHLWLPNANFAGLVRERPKGP